MCKQPILFSLVALCVLSGTNRRTEANNNLFLPGDAYFPTKLTAEEFAKLAIKKDRHEFVYSSFGGYESAFCGYAGYNRARITNMNDAFIANLKSAYAQIRKSEPRKLRVGKRDGKTVHHETNGVRVLFYNQSFEFPKFALGLRYNENWVAETVKFGHDPQSVRLCCIIDDKDAVIASGRDAKRVDPLVVTLPKIKLKPVPATDSPIMVKGKLKAIVLKSSPLVNFFRLNLFIALIPAKTLESRTSARLF